MASFFPVTSGPVAPWDDWEEAACATAISCLSLVQEGFSGALNRYSSTELAFCLAAMALAMPIIIPHGYLERSPEERTLESLRLSVLQKGLSQLKQTPAIEPVV